MDDPHGHSALFTNSNADYTRLNKILKKLSKSSSLADADSLAKEAKDLFMIYKQRCEHIPEKKQEHSERVEHHLDATRNLAPPFQPPLLRDSSIFA